MTARQDRDQKLRELSHRAFETHKIIHSQPDHWVIRREDGRGHYSTEIIATHHGTLYVGGDIQFVIFGHNNEGPRGRVRWMGQQPVLNSYHVEKATNGTGRELIKSYESDVAEEEIREALAELAELEKEEKYEPRQELMQILEEALEDHVNDTCERLMHFIYENSWYARDHFEHRGFGEVVDARVYYAHAAVVRLCELWNQEQQ
jgi:hypothetical protein